MILLISAQYGGKPTSSPHYARQGSGLCRPHERLANLMHSNAICKSAPSGESPQKIHHTDPGTCRPFSRQPRCIASRTAPCGTCLVRQKAMQPYCHYSGEAEAAFPRHAKPGMQKPPRACPAVRDNARQVAPDRFTAAYRLRTRCFAPRLSLLWANDQYASHTA